MGSGYFNTSVIPCNAMHGVRLGLIGEDFHDSESFWRYRTSPEVEGVFSELRCVPDAQCSSCNMRKSCGGGCVSNRLNYSFDDIRGHLHVGRS